MTTTDATAATPAADTMRAQALMDLQLGGRVIRQGTEFTIERRNFRPRQMREVTNESPARALDTFNKPPCLPPGGLVELVDTVKVATAPSQRPVLPAASVLGEMAERAARAGRP